MAGGIASALADASRRGGRTLTGDFGLFEVDEFWLGPVIEELEPRAMLLANLFRDQLDRYGELETIADRWALLPSTAAPASSSTPTTRSSPISAATPPIRGGGGGGARLFRRRRRLARAARAPARLGLQALPPLRPRLHLRGRLPRPPRPLPLPELRPEAPGADRHGHGRRAARDPQRRLHAARDARRAPAPGPLQRLQRARRRRAHALARDRPRRRGRGSGGRRAAPSAAPRRSTSTAAPPRSCWSRTRPAPTRS